MNPCIIVLRRAVAVACCVLPMGALGCALTSKADVLTPRYFSPEPLTSTRT